MTASAVQQRSLFAYAYPIHASFSANGLSKFVPSIGGIGDFRRRTTHESPKISDSLPFGSVIEEWVNTYRSERAFDCVQLIQIAPETEVR
jgi:hypothetical protein